MIDVIIVMTYIILCLYFGALIMRGWLRSSHHKLLYIKQFLGCETDEQCHYIQRGSLFIKRLKQGLVMTSFGVFLFAGDLLNATISYIERLEKAARPNLVWRWTVGWLQDPDKNNQLIQIWRIYDAFESLIFLVFLLVATRWMYADARCREGRFPNFYILMGGSFLINTAIYFTLWQLFGSMMNELRVG